MKKSEIQNQIISRITKKRIEVGWGQKNIAETLGISQGHVGNIESPNCNHKYTLAQIHKLCKQFGIPTKLIFLPDDSYMGESENITDLLIDKIIEYENK